MRTIYYILIALFMTVSFTACTSDSIAENEPTFEEEAGTPGDDGKVEEEDTAG
ncbi:hypothetical protein ABW636_09490 [Aquimarina sp. 2201CG1-2-11]|uniref:hypothetical protein n=1 Tax=Aquimarina discodermiae TaxID=3231043 RepID=UPI003461B6DB